MEENRLKPMQEDYNPALFNELFKRTEQLRKKLAYEIDPRRFGVENQDIVSWFNIKFIYVYNKYVNSEGMDEGQLLGHIINSLKTFKYRILRGAYTIKNSQSFLNFDEVNPEIVDDEDHAEKEYQLQRVMEFIKSKVSDNAYMLLETQIDVPLYIQARLEEEGIHDLKKLPNSVIRDYFELGNSKEADLFIATLKDEINQAIKLAKTELSI